MRYYTVNEAKDVLEQRRNAQPDIRAKVVEGIIDYLKIPSATASIVEEIMTQITSGVGVVALAVSAVNYWLVSAAYLAQSLLNKKGPGLVILEHPEDRFSFHNDEKRSFVTDVFLYEGRGKRGGLKTTKLPLIVPTDPQLQEGTPFSELKVTNPKVCSVFPWCEVGMTIPEFHRRFLTEMVQHLQLPISGIINLSWFFSQIGDLKRARDYYVPFFGLTLCNILIEDYSLDEDESFSRFLKEVILPAYEFWEEKGLPPIIIEHPQTPESLLYPHPKVSSQGLLIPPGIQQVCLR